MIIRFDKNGNMVILNGGTVFKNYVEVALANAISTGNPAYLNSIPRNIPGFMIGASTENACNGLGIDCGNQFRTKFMILVAGVLAMGGGRYNPSTTSVSVPESLYSDAYGDPDCPGCGYKPPNTGRTYPQNLNEQIAMKVVKADPQNGRILPITMSDPRWPASDGWVKMSQNINGIEIHYIYNTTTGQSVDFKFKYP